MGDEPRPPAPVRVRACGPLGGGTPRPAGGDFDGSNAGPVRTASPRTSTRVTCSRAVPQIRRVVFLVGLRRRIVKAMSDPFLGRTSELHGVLKKTLAVAASRWSLARLGRLLSRRPFVAVRTTFGLVATIDYLMC